MLAAHRPEAVGKSEKIHFVDRAQYGGHCLLDNFVPKRSNAQRSLRAVCLRDINPPLRLRPVAARLNRIPECHNLGVEIILVIAPCNAINASRR